MAACFCGMPSRSHWKATYKASASVLFLVEMGERNFPLLSLNETE
jgi:hypothetical protein